MESYLDYYQKNNRPMTIIKEVEEEYVNSHKNTHEIYEMEEPEYGDYGEIFDEAYRNNLEGQTDQFFHENF